MAVTPASGGPAKAPYTSTGRPRPAATANAMTRAALNPPHGGDDMPATLACNGFLAALGAGLRWLYSTEQPANALVERGGVRIATAERIVRFLPVGIDGDPLIIVDAAGGPASGVLPEAELPSLAGRLGALGVATQLWHYHGTTGTIVLASPAHPTLRAAVDRFSRGCPWHHSQVCDAPVSAGGQGCTWHLDGHKAAVWPHVTACGCRPTARIYHPRSVGSRALQSPSSRRCLVTDDDPDIDDEIAAIRAYPVSPTQSQPGPDPF